MNKENITFWTLLFIAGILNIVWIGYSTCLIVVEKEWLVGSLMFIIPIMVIREVGSFIRALRMCGNCGSTTKVMVKSVGRYAE